jgi:hypothetical protein
MGWIASIVWIEKPRQKKQREKDPAKKTTQRRKGLVETDGSLRSESSE